MYLMIFIIIFVYANGFTYQERPPITKQECSIKNQDITTGQEIKGKIIFFSKLQILQQFMTEIQEYEKLVNRIIDTKQQFQAQSQIIQDGLIEEIRNYYDDYFRYDYYEGLTEYKANKNPDDPQAVECYNDIMILNKKLIQIRDLVKNCRNFYQTSFDSLLKRRLFNINLIIKKMDMIQGYKQVDIEKEIAQLSRDHNICFGYTFVPINNLQQELKIIKKKRKQGSQKKQNQLNFIQTSKSINFVQENWSYQQYEPVNIQDCKIYRDGIEEDFLQFLKIQEIFEYIRTQKEQNELINKMTNFKDNFKKNNKIILQPLMEINKGITEVIEFSIDRSFQNIDTNHVNSAYQQYKFFHNQLNTALKIIKSVKELSNLLDDNYYQEINDLKIKINEFIKNKFNYQQEDVYKELKQINRDYKICSRHNDQNHYEKQIKVYFRRIVSETKEPLLENLSTEQKLKCKNLFDLKQNILNAQKNLVLLQYINERHYYAHPDQKKLSELFFLFFGINFNNTLIEFKNYLPNYKPDDVWAVKAYQRLQIINNVLMNFNKSEYNANYYLHFIRYDYEKLGKYQDDLDARLKELPQNKVLIQKQLDEYQNEYTICTGKYFNEVYKIEKEPQKSQQNKQYQVVLINKRRQKKGQQIKRLKNIKNQSLIQYSWKYVDYPAIDQSQCGAELNQIKEDILELQKIQVLFQYKNKYQKQYNELIAKILAIENDFVKIASQISQRLEHQMVFQFVKYPKNDNDRDPIAYAFNLLEKIDDKINLINHQISLSEDFFKFNEVDFSSIRYNNKLLNEYLDNDFKHNENDVEKELIQLYRDYEICRKIAYDKDSDENKMISHPTVLLQRNNQGALNKKKKNKLRRQMKYKQ